ncbi:xanthine/uracil permease [Pantoea coffeiphila]|nr:solute carrier family 23 protein [Pantoea coffeiphila]MBM7344478.1 xanthine/uracil permease [Pantoea coffeiphila]
MANVVDNQSTADPLTIKRIASLGIQHVLVMYAGTVSVPLILAAVLKLSSSQTITLINACLLTSGLATLLQAVGIGRFGSRLPLIQGCSFIVLAPMIMIGQQYGIATIFGSVIACGLFTMVAAPFFSRLVRFFPPQRYGWEEGTLTPLILHSRKICYSVFPPSLSLCCFIAIPVE